MAREDFYIHDDDPPGKQRILREGLRLFAQKGLSATSIRDIAAAAELSNPALYKHFRTKDDLALALFERAYREVLRRLTAATAREHGFAAKFRAYIVILAEFYDEHPHAMMFTTDNLAALWPHVPEKLRQRTVITLLRELLSDGRRDGLVGNRADPELQIALVTGMLNQITRQLYLGALGGPAGKYTDGIERILRSGLT